MAKQGSVKLHGRFKPGTDVTLIRARDGERSLRAQGGDEVGTATVDKHGAVEFSSGVESGERYFIVGYIDGFYQEVRVTGREKGEESTVVSQPPVQPDRVRLSDGSFLDEPPEQHQTPDLPEGSPHLGQHQVPKGVIQRSDTPRGSAHPVDPEEQAPYRRQEDVPKGTVQMSHTETGSATEIVTSVQRQEDAHGILQRSDTEHGSATPIPTVGAVQAQLEKESSAAKESRGEPVKASREPLSETKKSRRKAAKHADDGEGDDPLPELHDPPQDAKASETEDATTGAGQDEPTGEVDVTKAKRPRKSASKSTTAKKEK